jgi:RHS repeat-associated protein
MIEKIDGGTTTAYTYDDENRLTGVEITGGTTSVIAYAYDPFGRRIAKNVDGTITTYFYDKEAIILEYDQAGTVQTRYTHGINIDEPLAMEKNSQMNYYHADGLGSIIILTNASGNVVQTYNYDSFGNITTGLPTSQPYTYTAREYDTETGLYFYRARYYDPKPGRFLQRDPIGFEGGVNQYVYTGNNPVNWSDPLGLDRYNVCQKFSGIPHWICKKYVDWVGCRGEKNIVCCEAEQKECILRIDPCSPTSDKEAQDCYNEYEKCMSRTKK